MSSLKESSTSTICPASRHRKKSEKMNVQTPMRLSLSSSQRCLPDAKLQLRWLRGRFSLMRVRLQA
eukprot:754441-Hanusia_phi.AAC.2